MSNLAELSATCMLQLQFTQGFKSVLLLPAFMMHTAHGHENDVALIKGPLDISKGIDWHGEQDEEGGESFCQSRGLG